MKKLIPLLLAVLLLAACSTAPEVPTTLPPNTEALSSTESTTAPPPTTEAVPPVTEPTNPTGSFGVAVDFSQYTPRTPQESLYTRLSPDPITDLQPTEKPTRLYPFCRDTAEYGYYYTPTARFGMINEEGCILADPVYVSIYPLIDNSIENSTGVVFPFWILFKAENHIFEDESPFSSYSTYHCALASMDGTMVTECIYDTISVCEDRIIAVGYTEEGGSVFFDVFDPEGNMLLSSSELSFADRLTGDAWDYMYAEGFYTVCFDNHTLVDPDPDLYRPDEDWATYYMNEAGELAFGPFYDAGLFSDGFARVNTDSDDWYFINQEGVTVSPVYPWCASFRNGTVAVEIYDENENVIYQILNADFVPIIQSYNNIKQLEDGSFVTEKELYSKGDYRYATQCYSAGGALIAELESAEFLSSKLVLLYVDDNTTVLKNLETGKSLNLPGYVSWYLIGDPQNPYIELSYDEKEEYITRIITADLEYIYTVPEECYYLFRTEPGKPGTTVYAYEREGKTVLYNCYTGTEQTYPVSSFNTIETYPNGVLAVADNYTISYYNADGELFFSYPINPMDD